MNEITPKPAMNRIDLQTELESIQRQIQAATTGEDLRRLNAKRRTVEAKIAKVAKRDERTRKPGRKVRP